MANYRKMQFDSAVRWDNILSHLLTTNTLVSILRDLKEKQILSLAFVVSDQPYSIFLVAKEPIIHISCVEIYRPLVVLGIKTLIT